MVLATELINQINPFEWPSSLSLISLFGQNLTRSLCMLFDTCYLRLSQMSCLSNKSFFCISSTWNLPSLYLSSSTLWEEPIKPLHISYLVCITNIFPITHQKQKTQKKKKVQFCFLLFKFKSQVLRCSATSPFPLSKTRSGFFWSS